jgi:hypothetical protein
MGFLRRLLGNDPKATPATTGEPTPIEPVDIDAEERAYELELLKGEQARLDDLAQRQLRYAKYAWQPPAQGGERRADDHDADR